jgi:hypothetical protein
VHGHNIGTTGGAVVPLKVSTSVLGGWIIRHLRLLRRYPLEVAIGLVVLVALVSTVLPRSGNGSDPDILPPTWSDGYGLLGAILLTVVGLLVLLDRLLLDSDRRKLESGILLGVSTAAIGLVVTRLATLRHDTVVLPDNTTTSYGPQVGIWFALAAGVVLLMCAAISLYFETAPSRTLIVERSIGNAEVTLEAAARRPLIQRLAPLRPETLDRLPGAVMHDYRVVIRDLDHRIQWHLRGSDNLGTASILFEEVRNEVEFWGLDRFLVRHSSEG